MRWLTILLSDSFNNCEQARSRRYSVSSVNSHYASMQSFNRMILFAIPLMFIIKLSVFIMLYTFINRVQFAVAVTALCVFSRCFNHIFQRVENRTIRNLLHRRQQQQQHSQQHAQQEYMFDHDDDDDMNSMHNLQDHHLLAQCNYIHDIIHYVVTLLVPLMFATFGVNLQQQQQQEESALADGGGAGGAMPPHALPSFYYLQTVSIQFAIQSVFDLFPILLILFASPSSTGYPPNNQYGDARRGAADGVHVGGGGGVAKRSCYRNGGSFYRLSRASNLPAMHDEDAADPMRSASNTCCSSMALSLKIDYINMMNGWTATDKCVRDFMWWSTIFIAGYFAFYLLYPQQFFCAFKAHHQSILFGGDWIYTQC